MSDQSYLAWPFLEDSHRSLAREVSDWAAAQFDVDGFHDHADVDADCAAIRAANSTGVPFAPAPSSGDATLMTGW